MQESHHDNNDSSCDQSKGTIESTLLSLRVADTCAGAPPNHGNKQGKPAIYFLVDLGGAEWVILSNSARRIHNEALSCFWGYHATTKEILCNGQSCLISCNLEQAMRFLCLSSEPRYVWVDAFCVNQGSGKEKTAQVQNMQLIFFKAMSMIDG